MALGRTNFTNKASILSSLTFDLAIGTEHEAADWILDISFATSTQTPIVAYFITAHNDVFAIRSKATRALDISVSQIASGLSSILYSAHIKPISATTILVAAGTVFGEVIVWSCYRSTSATTHVETEWHSRTYNVFRGHDGSIFGVCLSDRVELTGDRFPGRLLASCSDDRTIRLWDVSKFDNLLEAGLDVSEQHHEIAQRTGFGSIADASIAATWGHLSRIWAVGFIHGGASANPSLLISRGEDATCQIWNLTCEVPIASTDNAVLGRRDLRFDHSSTDHHHAGKHIWSHASHSENSSLAIFTGGSDGGIIARSISSQENGSSYLSIQTPFYDLFRYLKPKLAASDTIRTHHNDSVKQYVFISANVIFATTNYGKVIKGIIEAREHTSTSIEWMQVFHATGLGALAIMASDTTEGIVYLGSARGNIWVYSDAIQSIKLLAKVDQKISNIFTGTSWMPNKECTVRHLLVCSTTLVTARLLVVTQLHDEPDSLRVLKNVELRLPSTFQPTAFVDVSEGNLLILGSRSGALAIYLDAAREGGTANGIAPAFCARHIHGSDTVTHLQSFSAAKCNEQDPACYEIISTGKDGSYAIHKITFRNCEPASRSPVMTTLHRSCPPFGPNIEGASVRLTSSSSPELLLHGFDGKNFRCWNESRNSEVISIPCGGAHRNWAYSSKYLDMQSGVTSQGGCFVWTKAGVFNMARFFSPAHEIVQPGGHGREIKAMAVQKEDPGHDGQYAPTMRLIATGAEDTAIRLWMVTTVGKHAHVGTQSLVRKDNASCIRVLKKHTTGIQHLSFCQNFLFSSAGCEELFIWKLNFGVGVVSIGTVFLAALPKHAVASDLRITSFKAIFIACDPAADSLPEHEHIHIYTTYSNSTVRVFRYTNDHALPPGDRFQLMAEGCYNATCLTNICLLSESTPWFLTASTNGAVAVWPVVDHHKNATEQPSSLSYMTEHFIHQNAILALHTVRLGPKYYLLLTGGDDNALGITLILESAGRSMLCESSGDKDGLPTPRLRTLLMPRAHAAAITALEVIDLRKETHLTILTVVSTGNDQRLKIWRVTVNLDELSQSDHDPRTSAGTFGPEALRAIEVQLVEEMWTSVADASSIAVLTDVDDIDRTAGDVETVDAGSGSGKGKKLMIAGIGMEMVSIDLADGSGA